MLKHAWQTPAFLTVIAGASATMFARFALAAWLAPFYQTHFGLEAVDYGPKLGVIIVVGGGMSAVLGGCVL
jgi:hypothetical protein